jgi:hypothetical protein
MWLLLLAFVCLDVKHTSPHVHRMVSCFAARWQHQHVALHQLLCCIQPGELVLRGLEQPRRQAKHIRYRSCMLLLALSVPAVACPLPDVF